MSGKNEKQASARENQPERSIAISATFTAEPVEQSLTFWAHQLELPLNIQFAPYNQVFQQLLDPSSIISKNKNGINVVLLRFEDWLRDGKRSICEKETQIRENVKDLIVALRSSSDRSSTPYLICVCPPSPVPVTDEGRMSIYQEMEDLMFSESDRINNLYVVRASALTSTYPVSNYYDPHSDKVGHVPYTPDFFTALGTIIARKFYRIQSAPYKVVILDCDHTLWNGVCGEDGPLGVRIDEPYNNLQTFMVEQVNAGMLVCLCSKNSEEDVIQVFESRPEMVLKREHIVSWRINWKPKSENIKSLAVELQLGLDSFIFIDDSPVECAEVQANCPEVLSLQLPGQPDEIPRFLKHVWAFDQLKITDEDRKRTSLYHENIKREHFLQESLTFRDFIEGLELNVKSFEPMPLHLPRVAQLTKRTNQFNFTTIRRSEGELKGILDSRNLECLCIEVSDRFGDYGLVGVILFKEEKEAIKVDTFLLSCRVLGRGVEHQLLARLGQKAVERGLPYVEVAFVRSKRNQPALDFLEAIGSKHKEADGEGFLFRFPSEYVKKLNYSPGKEIPSAHVEMGSKKQEQSQMPGKVVAQMHTKSELLGRIARNLFSVEEIAKIIESQDRKQRPELKNEYAAPRNDLERSIAQIWQNVLGIEKVGIHDKFLELGGNSLLGTRIVARVAQETGVRITLQHLFESPTGISIANFVETVQSAKRERPGTAQVSDDEREVIAF
jgi:FkbH-like protein